MTDDKTIIRVLNREIVKRRNAPSWCWSCFFAGLAVGVALACIVARIAFAK